VNEFRLVGCSKHRLELNARTEAGKNQPSHWLRCILSHKLAVIFTELKLLLYIWVVMSDSRCPFYWELVNDDQVVTGIINYIHPHTVVAPWSKEQQCNPSSPENWPYNWCDYSSVNRYHCELVGRPIKRQHQPLDGRVIHVEISDRYYLLIFVKHQVSTQHVATASLTSKL